MTTTSQRTPEQTSPVGLVPKLLWNAVAPVSRLPSEVLAHIFLHYVRGYHCKNWRDTGVPRWVNVSYVCSHWRYVALNYPILWSYLFIASPRWTDVSLIRSKEVPLSVCLQFTLRNRKTILDFIAQVTPHVQRFRECHLEVQCMDTELVLSMLSSRTATLLHTLTVAWAHFLHPWNQRDLNWDGEVVLDVWDSEAASALTLFNGDPPVLRELHLSSCPVMWRSPMLGGLTVLRLRELYHSVQPTVAELMVMLSRMPDLAELYLENAIRDGPDDPAHLDAEQVHLPKLAYLKITAPFSSTVLFLSCLDIPATTHIKLSCHFETHSDRHDYTLLYAFISQRFNNFGNEATSVAPICTMTVDNGWRHTSIIFSRSERKCGREKCMVSFHEDCDCDVPFKISIDSTPHAEHCNDLVVGICRSVPLGRLKNLILDSLCHSAAFWFDIFWDLPELRYIELIDGNLSDVLTLLSVSSLPENVDGPTGQHAPQLFAPSLEELRLNGVRIPWHFRCAGKAAMAGRLVLRFRDVLAQRRAMGHALERLFITGSCSLREKDVAHLQEVVSQVKVNELTRLVTHDEAHCEICKEETEAAGDDAADSLQSVVGL